MDTFLAKSSSHAGFLRLAALCFSGLLYPAFSARRYSCGCQGRILIVQVKAAKEKADRLYGVFSDHFQQTLAT